MKSSFALSLFLSSGLTAAFGPAAFGQRKASRSIALEVSAVRDVLIKQLSSSQYNNSNSLEEQVLQAFEMETPESVGIAGPEIQSSEAIPTKKSKTRKQKKNSRKKRKHNFKEQPHLQEEPDLDFFTLHSSAVSHLEKDMPINDIVRAIKRAQNLHDIHDLATIEGFLIDHCDQEWGFGYRGSLLSRLAVASLHCGQVELADRAIQTRRVQERPSMQPYESSAIIRGLLRVGRIEEGWAVLEDELRLPMDGLPLEAESSYAILRERAYSLSSMATRHFYEGEPYLAARALNELGNLGSVIEQAHMEDLAMPWTRLVTAATTCMENLEKSGWSNARRVNNEEIASTDLTELVYEAMNQFPCPGEAEECSIDDYLNLTP